MTSHGALLPTPDWTRAECREKTTNLFYPGVHDDPGPARQVCRACAITSTCLEWALATRQAWGIWGGATAQQRTTINKRRKAQASQQRPSGARGRLLTQVAEYLNNRPAATFTATELAHGLHRDLPDVTSAVMFLVTTGQARLVDTRPRRYGAAGEVPARLGNGQLRGTVRTHFETQPAGTEMTSAEVTRAINSTSQHAVSSVLRWLTDHGELHRHPTNTATRYSATPALKTGTESHTAPRRAAPSPQTLQIRHDVHTYLCDHPSGLASTGEIAHATRHSRTAVINALTWLIDQHKVRQITERPRRYSATDTAPEALAS